MKVRQDIFVPLHHYVGLVMAGFLPACQLLDLANNECCGIALYPQCKVIHVHIGPLSL